MSQDKTTKALQEPIAIVGMACRFPGEASSIAGYWRLLSEGMHVISDIPQERFDANKYFDANQNAAGKTYVKRGSFINGVSEFDAPFFNIPPREAIAMDPQQRILLECCWEALEDSGVAPDSLNQSQTGVFIGCIDSEYRNLLEHSKNHVDYEALIPTGAFTGAIAGRISYTFGFEGPSMVIDTHYSASLVALHTACQSLRYGECDMALAGGVHFILSPEGYILFSRNHTLSPDGYSKTFDIDANGFGRGEGCGVLVLKRLSDAVANGDRIHAVIRGSAANQDGHSSSLTAPNEQAQEHLIRQALLQAQIAPKQIGYIEAHGTGTPLGDPIELQAINAVFQIDRDKNKPLYIGSVKTNIGHLEAASGIAGVIKVILALKHKQIPAHLHLKQLNPNIKLQDIPAVIPKELTTWEPIDGKRIAGVSSFGIVGTNAHVVLEEYTSAYRENLTEIAKENLLCISAKSPVALKAMVEQFILYLSNSIEDLNSICYTANAKRTHFANRVAVTGNSNEEIIAALKSWQNNAEIANTSNEKLLPTLKLYIEGKNINWDEFYNNTKYKIADIPTYAFQRQRYWVDEVTADVPSPTNEQTLDKNYPANEFVQQLINANHKERRELMIEYLQSEVRHVLGLSISAPVNITAGLMDMGISSILAADFRNNITIKLGAIFSKDLPRTLIFHHPTIDKLTDYLLTEVLMLENKKAVVLQERSFNDEPIAIIGMSCRFPGKANNLDDYWALLSNGVDAITDIPKTRFDWEQYYDSNIDAPHKMYVKGGGFIQHADLFDAGFFGISPREAIALDPQQRILLEVSWEALENTGIAIDKLFGSNTGVYVGLMATEYEELLDNAFNNQEYQAHIATGNLHSTAAGRLSYAFGFEGPAMAIDTACSSSLVALHLACDSLKSDTCDMALACGVNIIATAEGFINFSKLHALSPDSHCKTFDKDADGYARGEGCGVLVLKRLSDAVNSKDNILAIIRGSAVNQDGRSSSLTAPNGASQENVVRQALHNAKLKPNQISYVEAHGTGTPLGDPIEIKSLGKVLGEGRDSSHPLIISSVKTNIGHTESAAGVAGVIKTVLAMQHKKIPRHLNFKVLNPEINLDEIPAKIPLEQTNWEPIDGKRIAGISSFGISGTNAHVIIEEPPVNDANITDKKSNTEQQILCVSAKTDIALSEIVQQYIKYLQNNKSIDIKDFCYSANTGRMFFNNRLAVISKNTDEVIAKLSQWLNDKDSTDVISGESHDLEPKIVFMFTGQGSQYAGMGKDLYNTYSVFKNAINECAKILESIPSFDKPLLDILFGEENSLLKETQYTQPVLFVFEYALYKLVTSWGIIPSSVLGHSVGEYVAACVAGVFTLQDGLKLICKRAKLMQDLPRNGAMLAVTANKDKVLEVIAKYQDKVGIAAINAASSIVISGDKDAINELVDTFDELDIETTLLVVSHAFHSHLLEPMLDDLKLAFSEVKLNTPTIDLISNLTGKNVVGEDIITPDYWIKHTRSAVLFAPSIEYLLDNNYTTFVEIGPHPVLTALAMQTYDNWSNGHPKIAATMIATLNRNKENGQTLLEALGKLFVSGIGVDWDLYYADNAYLKVQLPNYVFQRERYWVTPSVANDAKARNMQHAILSYMYQTAAKQNIFDGILNVESETYLIDHKIFGHILIPAALFVEIMLNVTERLKSSATVTLSEIIIDQPLVISKTEQSAQIKDLEVIVNLDADYYDVKIYSKDVSSGFNDEVAEPMWVEHASAKIKMNDDADKNPTVLDKTLQDTMLQCNVPVAKEKFYDKCDVFGYNYGPMFQGLSNLRKNDNNTAIYGEITLQDKINSDQYIIHPVIIDCCLQLMVELFDDVEPQYVYLPYEIQQCELYSRPTGICQVYATLRSSNDSRIKTLDIILFGSDGSICLKLSGYSAVRTTRTDLEKKIYSMNQSQLNTKDLFYEMVWQAQQSPEIIVSKDPKTWILLADQSGVANELAILIQATGDKAVQISSAGIDLSESEAYKKIFNQISSENEQTEFPVKRIIHLWGLDSLDLDVTNQKSQQLVYESSLKLMQDLIAHPNKEWQKNVSLYFITSNAQAVTSEQNKFSAIQSQLWGLFRVFKIEHPEINSKIIDLDFKNTFITELWHELNNFNDETEVSFRDNQRLVSRLKRKNLQQSKYNPYRDILCLDFSERGVIDNLEFKPTQRTSPGPNEVEIEVLATGLNFRDVLNVMGMYPGNPGALGCECSGKIVAVGSDVSNVAVGDDVMCLTMGAFSKYLNVDAHLVVKKPASLTFEQAAAIPLVYATVEYSLKNLANLHEGQSILIHAATGGVGMAAVQIAKNSGAVIYATAGSDEKRELLRSLGIEHIFSSRTLDFAQEINKLTNGRGVDVVLNSLSDDFIPASLGILNDNGVFVEIGKRNIWTKDQVAAVKPNVSYHIVAIDQLSIDDPKLVGTVLKEIVTNFSQGKLTSMPVKAYPITDVTEAFKFMANRRHVGKIVVSWQQQNTDIKVTIKENTAYLITGGLGGIGLKLADWLISQNAKHLILIGRQKPSDETATLIGQWQERGVKVTTEQVDIADALQVTKLISEVLKNNIPLGGIIHAAGILDDAFVNKQDFEKYKLVMAPKIIGAWNLYQNIVANNLKLDFFIAFSSVVSILGNVGQANYAAANAFLDTFAFFMRSKDINALTINWGAWGQIGMAASGINKLQLQSGGVIPMQPELGIKALAELLSVQFKPETAIMHIDWEIYMRQVPNKLAKTILSNFIAKNNDRKIAYKEHNEFVQNLINSDSNSRQNLLLDFLRNEVRKALGLSQESKIDITAGLAAMGMDSLIAVEFKNRLIKTFGDLFIQSLPATLIYNYPTIEKLSTYLLTDVLDLEKKTQVTINKESKHHSSEPIAIVGMACKFPGNVNNLKEYWKLLSEGQDAIITVPADRFDIDQYYDPDPDMAGKMYPRAGGFITDVANFDARFFGVSPIEAIALDPQQRLLLETTWQALENAKIIPGTLSESKTGVFVGIISSEYQELLAESSQPQDVETNIATGNYSSTAAGRLSYTFGLKGPALAVDTACSSSLVALHLACKSILDGESEQAIAAGVNVLAGPDGFIYFSRMRVLAPDGHCKTFDVKADGYARGEGCGVLILKRLSDAKSNGDNILAVIKGTAINQDGRSSSLTAPNGVSQQELITQALANADVKPHQVSYIEAHGTGTPLGDPIEVNSLGAVYSIGRDKDNVLTIGSVKTNLGHLEAAAGMAGVIKTVLAMQHKQIPKHLNFSMLNPHINLDAIPAQIPNKLQEWRAADGKLIAGISGFGFSGTNAHVIIEAVEKTSDISKQNDSLDIQLLCISAQTDTSLRALAELYVKDILSTDCNIAEICSSAVKTRSMFDHRLAVIAKTASEMSEKINNWLKLGKNYDVESGVISNNTANSDNYDASASSDRSELVRKIAIDFVKGLTIDWKLLYDDSIQTVELPTYQFEKERYWVAANTKSKSIKPKAETAEKFPLLGRQFDIATNDNISFISELDLNSFSILGEHRVYDNIVLPAVGYIDMALSAGSILFPESKISLEDVEFEKALVMSDIETVNFQTVLNETSEDGYDFEMFSKTVAPGKKLNQDEWRLHVHGKLIANQEVKSIKNSMSDLMQIVQRCKQQMDASEFKQVLIDHGMGFGPKFLGLDEKVYIGDQESFSQIRLSTDYLDEFKKYTVFPGILDSCLQLFIGSMVIKLQSKLVFLPVGIQRLNFYKSPGTTCWAHATWQKLPESNSPDNLPKKITGDIRFYDESGELLVEIIGLSTVPAPREAIARLNSTETSTNTATANNNLYTIQWRVLNDLNPYADILQQSVSSWLIIHDKSSIASQVISLLKNNNQTVIEAAYGKHFSQIDDTHFTLDFADPNAVEEFYSALIKSNVSKLEALLYFVPNNYNIKDINAYDEIVNTQRYSYGSTLNLAQALLIKDKSIACNKFVMLTNHAVGDKTVQTDPFQASVWGLGKVITLENPELHCLNIDLDIAETSPQQDDYILREILHGSNVDQIAFRNNKRVLPQLAHYAGGSESSALSTNIIISPDSSYLITGGLGALGILFAEHLVEKGARNLVLIGRNAPNTEVRSRIETLRHSNVQVKIMAADIAQFPQVKEVFDDIKNNMPSLAGIIHAAGIIDDAPILNQNFVKYLQIMQPKIAGSWNLHLLTKDMSLDFFIMFSSIASLIGNPGQANYAAANSFMNSLAQYRNSLGLCATSIEWGPWAEIGMAVNVSKSLGVINPAMHYIKSNESLTAFDTILTSNVNEIAVIDVDWAKLHASGMAQSAFYEKLIDHAAVKKPKLSATTELFSKIIAYEPAERKTMLVDLMRGHVAKVLGYDSESKVDINKPLIDHGLNSLMAVMLRNTLKKTLGEQIKLPSTLIFDYPTVTLLAGYLDQQFEKLSGTAVSATKETSKSKKIKTNTNEPLAIIGVACRFPGGANSLGEYWQLLNEGRDAVTEVPGTRWSLDEFYDPDPDAEGKMYCKWGGFLNTDVDKFDAAFFNIVPVEAETMDPQQRLVLEVSWEALEMANIDPLSIAGTQTGVFFGVSTADYSDLSQQFPIITSYTNSGMNRSVISGRLSYLYGLKGPSFVVDTACSSSLVATHQACVSLRSGESDMAIVGGVNLMLTPAYTIGFCKGRYLAPDGKCKTFDDSANGYVRGEGCGVIILKRLSDAKRDGNNIYALIRGSAVEQDGASGGLTVPNGPAQEHVITQALANGEVNPSQINYIEAHGTGTSLGDPIEMHALMNVYKEGRSNDSPLTISSVKTNFGHLEAAAGMAGLIKIILAMQHEKIPRHLHFKTLNHNINLDEDIKIIIPTEEQEWKRGSYSRFAGVSGFAFQGTNAHVILEEAPPKELRPSIYDESQIYVLPLSAKNDVSLHNLVKVYIEYLQHTENNLADICYSASVSRMHFENRIAFAGHTIAEITQQMQQWLNSGINEISNNELATRYMSKEHIVWGDIYPKDKLNRVILPTYQYDKQRYWVNIVNPEPVKSIKNNLFYKMVWRAEELLESDPINTKKIIVFSSKNVTFNLADNFQVEIINSNDSDSIANSFTRIKDEIATIGGIVYIADSEPETFNFEAHLKHYANALNIAQLMLKNDMTNMRLYFVTRDAVYINNDKVVDLNNAQLAGLGRTISLEYPNLQCTNIDIDALSTDKLVTELQVNDTEDLIVYRDKLRYVPRLKSDEQLDSLYAKNSDVFKINIDGTYLITGGLGGIGLEIAKWLIKNGVKHLALLGRSSPKPEVIELINKWQNDDLDVKTITADVADFNALELAITDILKTGSIAGIFHAAGSISHARLLEQDIDKYTKVANTKVLGSWNLQKIVENKKIALDVFVHFSSTSAILGNMSQANYAAANSFLDAFVHYQRLQAVPAVLINWGAWQDTGLAANVGENSKALSGLEPNIATKALGVVLANATNDKYTSIVMNINWRDYLDAFGGVSSATLLQDMAAQYKAEEPDKGKTSEFTKELLLSNIKQRKQLVLNMLKEQVSGALGIKEQTIDSNAGFMDLGFTSLLSVDFRASLIKIIGKKYKKLLPATLLFDYPTIDKLAEYIVSVIDTTVITDVSLGLDTTQSNVDILNSPIAIIGMGCKFPGNANSPEAFWNNLIQGNDAIVEIPTDRFDAAKFYSADPDDAHTMYATGGGFVKEAALFDAQFFGISPREAEALDPQQRILHEVTWNALENANLNPDKLFGSNTGVFVGIAAGEYLDLLESSKESDSLEQHMATGNSANAAAGRISYTFGFNGPSIAIDTACSSSLSAIHLACQSLRTGNCDMALACGVNVMVGPEAFMMLSRMRALAFDNHCKTFDKNADGYARGEGCGVLVLKRLHEAERDGDNILAVIKGSAVNQDGRSSSLSAPNGVAQVDLLKQALKVANLKAQDVSYIEAHGTGTPLGDPIEVQSIAKVYGKERDIDNPLILGTVKTNIGHTESAAGVAGVIKTVLAMQHQQIPKHLNFKTLNPNINLEEFHGVIPIEQMAWNPKHKTRIAGVSSFGISGTNVHVLLEEYAKPESVAAASTDTNIPYNLLGLSAKDETALQELVKQYVVLNKDINVADLCYSTNSTRAEFNCKLAVAGNSLQEIQDKLSHWLNDNQNNEVMYSSVSSVNLKIVFMFTGQGSQYAGMGKELYATSSVFKNAIDDCDNILKSLEDFNKSLLDIIFSEENSLLKETQYTQPVLFAFEYALYKLITSWGIEPDVVLGHSVGEYVAACVAGVFSLEDGLKLICKRARLMQDLPSNGAMLAVSSTKEKVLEVIAKPQYKDKISIAAINAPSSIVISGDKEAVNELVDVFDDLNIETALLIVSHAFHSHLLEPMLDNLKLAFSEIKLNAPNIDLISNLTGMPVAKDEIVTADYWIKHTRNAVLFAPSVECLLDNKYSVFVEVGPHPVLTALFMQTQEKWLSTHDNVNTIPSAVATLSRNQANWETLLFNLAKLFVAGVKINWSQLYQDGIYHKIQLPHYPFQKQRYWINGGGAKSRAAIDYIDPLLGKKLSSPLLEDNVVYEAKYNLELTPVIGDHRIYQKIVIPGAFHISRTLNYVVNELNLESCSLQDIAFPQAIIMEDTSFAMVQFILSIVGGNKFNCQFVSKIDDNKWVDNVECSLDLNHQTPANADTLETLKQRLTAEFSMAEYNAYLSAKYQYGHGFIWVEKIWNTAAEALGLMRQFDTDESNEYILPPGLIDCCFQLFTSCMLTNKENGMFETSNAGGSYIPVGIGNFSFYRVPVGRIYAHATLDSTYQNTAKTFKGDVALYDDAGTVFAKITGFIAQQAPMHKLLAQLSATKEQDIYYAVQWHDIVLSKASPEKATIRETWLAFITNEQNTSASILTRLIASNANLNIIKVLPGKEFNVTDNNNYVINPNNKEDYVKLINSLATVDKIIYLWPVDDTFKQQRDIKSFTNDQERNYSGLLYITQSIVMNSKNNNAKLYLITQNAQNINDNDTYVALPATPLLGFARTCDVEYPNLMWQRIDVEANNNPAEQDAILLDIINAGTNTDDREIAIRNGKAYVPKLVNLSLHEEKDQLAIPEGEYQLYFAQRGSIENLEIINKNRNSIEPKDDEVIVKIAAAGLNFRDVMNVMGVYPGDPGGIGGEASGEVITIGKNVTKFKPGDKVYGLGLELMASIAAMPELMLQPLPENISFEEAASIPLVYATSHLGINHLARLKKDEKILIHAGAGGIGISAIQLANEVGAEIFVTVGSDEKRELMLKYGIKPDHIFNSRNLDFYQQILDYTDNEGVDVVINSLTKDFIIKSFTLVKNGGRFIEIGKTDILTTEKAHELNPNVGYYTIAIDKMMVNEQEKVNELLNELNIKLAKGTIKPLPIQIFDLSKAKNAFYYMAQGKHKGKIVLSNIKDQQDKINNVVSIHPDKTYIVTGGLGGIGLKVAKWLADKGAGHIALISRSNPSAEALGIINSMKENKDIIVNAYSCDVANADSIKDVLTKITNDMPSLSGIIHAAGVIDDALIAEQSHTRYDKVAGSKVFGAWNIYNYIKDHSISLDFFIGFSSASAILGNPGQSNYAAANALLDAFINSISGTIAKTISIEWGPWSQVGMAATMDRASRDQLSLSGIKAFTPITGIAALNQIFMNNNKQHVVIALDIDWSKFIQGSTFVSPILNKITETIDVKNSSKRIDKNNKLVQDLTSAEPQLRREIIANYLESEVKSILRLDANMPVDRGIGLTIIGMDSLMAVEFRNRIIKTLGGLYSKAIPATLMFNYPNIDALTEYLLIDVLALEEKEVQEVSDHLQEELDLIDEKAKSIDDDNVESELLAALLKAKKNIKGED